MFTMYSFSQRRTWTRIRFDIHVYRQVHCRRHGNRKMTTFVPCTNRACNFVPTVHSSNDQWKTIKLRRKDKIGVSLEKRKIDARQTKVKWKQIKIEKITGARKRVAAILGAYMYLPYIYHICCRRLSFSTTATEEKKNATSLILFIALSHSFRLMRTFNHISFRSLVSYKEL